MPLKCKLQKVFSLLASCRAFPASTCFHRCAKGYYFFVKRDAKARKEQLFKKKIIVTVGCFHSYRKHFPLLKNRWHSYRKHFPLLKNRWHSYRKHFPLLKSGWHSYGKHFSVMKSGWHSYGKHFSVMKNGCHGYEKTFSMHEKSTLFYTKREHSNKFILTNQQLAINITMWYYCSYMLYVAYLVTYYK